MTFIRLFLTTAVRRIAQFEGAALLERSSDPDDGRRSNLRLTAAAIAAVERFARALG